MKTKILLVEDDAETAYYTKTLLEDAGFGVLCVDSVELALDTLGKMRPDLVLSDVQLPGLSGIRLCQIMKTQDNLSNIPIILLTVLGKEINKVEGLKIGADDYVTKPYSAKELLARVEALLRRVQNEGKMSNVFRMGPLTVDVDRHQALIANQRLTLTPKEFDLLVLFLKHPDNVLSKSFILSSLWQMEANAISHTLQEHIRSLRKKLAPYNIAIETTYRRGYRLTND